MRLFQMVSWYASGGCCKDATTVHWMLQTVQSKHTEHCSSPAFPECKGCLNTADIIVHTRALTSTVCVQICDYKIKCMYVSIQHQLSKCTQQDQFLTGCKRLLVMTGEDLFYGLELQIRNIIRQLYLPASASVKSVHICMPVCVMCSVCLCVCLSEYVFATLLLLGLLPLSDQSTNTLGAGRWVALQHQCLAAGGGNQNVGCNVSLIHLRRC